MKLKYSNPLVSENMRDKLAELQMTLKSWDNGLYRVIMWVHEDETRARHEMQRLLRKHAQDDPILAIICDETKRRRHFGPLKREFLKAEFPGPLYELLEIFRDRRDTLIRITDVEKAYRQALESEERQRFEERALAIQQSRDEPKHENSLGIWRTRY